MQKGIALERLYELLSYDREKGCIYSIKTGRQVHPCIYGFCIINDPETKKKVKFKFSKLCYALGNARLPTKQERIFHKNLNQKDFTLSNLVLLNAKQYLEASIAVKNLESAIKIVPHFDMFTYKVFWIEDGFLKHKVVQDIVVAKRIERILRLRFTKILSKYSSSY